MQYKANTKKRMWNVFNLIEPINIGDTELLCVFLDIESI